MHRAMQGNYDGIAYAVVGVNTSLQDNLGLAWSSIIKGSHDSVRLTSVQDMVENEKRVDYYLSIHSRCATK